MVSSFPHNSSYGQSRCLNPARTTVFIITVGDMTFPACQEAIRLQDTQAFVLDIIRNVHPMSAAFQEMITRCQTEYFIQVDEDMILHPTAVREMEQLMLQAPKHIGMICCHLYDEDRETTIQGVKIYRTASLQSVVFQNVKACEMDLLAQMGAMGIRWVLHPSIQGRHGTLFSPETIYRRYKSMYEKDILEWNDVTGDIKRKARQFRETGDPLALFALLGAVDGIVSVPTAQDKEKDFTKYNLKSLEIFRRIFLESQTFPFPYEAGKPQKRPCVNPPLLPEDVREWAGERHCSSELAREEHEQEFVKISDGLKASERPGDPQRILLICHWFWPSVGGVETIVADLGEELIGMGYRVDVATVGMAERTTLVYRGMNIIPLDDTRTLEPSGIPYFSLEVYRLLTSGQYYACVMFADALSWLLTAFLLGKLHPETRTFIQLLVNQESYDKWRQNSTFKERLLKTLQTVDGVLILTEKGLDAEYVKAVGIQPYYLPNATTPAAVRMDFRKRFAISPETFLVVHVANILKVKNHLGLLYALPCLPSNRKLVLIGRPFHKNNAEEEKNDRQVRDMLKNRPDILFIPGLGKEDVGAALQSADVVVLASLAEVSPMVLLEAMSHGTPWLATPDCGDVAEKAGGIVAPLDMFPVVLTVLQQNPHFRQALGTLGYAHWKSCFNWEVVGEGWREILETGRLSKSYAMPKAIADSMECLQSQFNDLLLSSLAYSHSSESRLSDYPRCSSPKEEDDRDSSLRCVSPFPLAR